MQRVAFLLFSILACNAREPDAWLQWSEACQAVRSLPSTPADEVPLLQTIATGTRVEALEALRRGAARVQADTAARNVLCDRERPCEVTTREAGLQLRVCVPEGAPALGARLCDPWGEPAVAAPTHGWRLSRRLPSFVTSLSLTSARACTDEIALFEALCRQASTSSSRAVCSTRLAGRPRARLGATRSAARLRRSVSRLA